MKISKIAALACYLSGPACASDLPSGPVKDACTPAADAGSVPVDAGSVMDGQAPRAFAINEADPSVTSVRLQDYWPTQAAYTPMIMTKNNGHMTYAHVFYPAGRLQPLYDQYLNTGVVGRTFIKEQRWNLTASDQIPLVEACPIELDFWQFGDDGSITEAGSYSEADVRPAVNCNVQTRGPFGYTTYGTPVVTSGLTNSGAAPLTKEGIKNFDLTNTSRAERAAGMHVFHLFSDMRLINVYPKFQPAYGRNAAGVWGKGNGRVFERVAHVIFYHGGIPHPAQINTTDPLGDCFSYVKPENPEAVKYVHNPGYNTYAVEFYYAPGKGVIQGALLYSENNLLGVPKCIGGSVFGTTEDWKEYLDER
jgi:hypothetical protein